MPSEDYQERLERLSLEFLRTTCIFNIKASVGRLIGVGEESHDKSKAALELEREMDALQRRLKAIAFEFRVKGWPLPDYHAWQETGIYPE